MTASAFYKKELALTMVAGVYTFAAAPDAYADSSSKIHKPTDVTTSRVFETKRSEIPKSSLFMTQPPQLPEAGRNPSIHDLLGRAFSRDDLNSLYGAGGFTHCETSSRIPSFFEKNYSNFAAECLNDLRSKNAITFDERFRANPESEGIAPSPLGGGLQWTSISAGARERLLQRSIHDLAQKNKTLADILQGRISFDFGLGQIFSDDSSSAAKAEPARPRYVVEVSDPIPENTNKKRTLLASIGKLPDGSVKKEGVWFAQKPLRTKRRLKETFEPAASADSKEESIVPVTAHLADPSASDSALSSIRYVTRMAGLSSLPFSKLNMRAERRLIEGRNQFALRATESQDLFFAELPDIRQASSSSLVWGYRVPWKQHSVAVRNDESTDEKVTTYSFRIDNSNKSEVNYNHKTNAVSAGFTMTF
ncbi:MAG: hypothetical protein RLZZ488_2615 [Pseudomonadota bacterium]|jgi:hypothetical protein